MQVSGKTTHVSSQITSVHFNHKQGTEPKTELVLENNKTGSYDHNTFNSLDNFLVRFQMAPAQHPSNGVRY